MKFLLVLALVAAALCSPVAAHNYAAPALYLAGIYSPTGEPVKYPVASDAEMAWILKQLESGTPKVRAIAAGALGQTNNPKAVEPLLGLLQDEDDQVQYNASFGFFHIKDPRVVEPLKKIVTDLSMRDVMGVCYALVAQGDAGIDFAADQIDDYNPDGERFGGNPYRGIAEVVVLSKGIDAIPWAGTVLKGPNSKRHPVALSVLSILQTDEPKDRVKAVVSDIEITSRLIDMARRKPNRTAEVLSLLRDCQDPRVQQLRKAKRKFERDEEDKQAARWNEIAREDSVRAQKAMDAKLIRQLAAEIRKARPTPKRDGQLEAQEAANQLGQSTKRSAVNVLIKILNEKNPVAARIAARGLSSGRTPEARKALVSVLSKPKHPAYKETVEAVVYMWDRDITIRLLQSKDEFAVSTMLAFLAMEKSRQLDLQPYLGPLLKNPRYRKLAALALAQYSDPAALDILVNSLSDEVKPSAGGACYVCDAINRYGKSANEKVLAKLRDSDPWMRAGAARYFLTRKEPRAVDPLIAALGDQDVRVRRRAIEALVFQNDCKAAPHYVEALKDSDSEVRRVACRAVVTRPDPSSKEALVGLLKDTQESTRTCAGLALAQLGDSRGTSAVARTLSQEDRNEGLLVPAILAAGKLHYKQATGQIIGILGADIRMSVTEGGSEEEMAASRTAKLETLKSLTGQDFGWAFYRWMAWWVAQGHTPDWELL